MLVLRRLFRDKIGMIALETVKASLSYAKEKNIKDVLIVGGEPTLHPEIISIANLVKDFGFRAILTTNYTKPETVKKLDGIIDCFNISFYCQQNLPKQSEYKSDLTLHALIHKKQLSSQEKLDNFIDSHRENGHLKFSTLVACNTWAAEHQNVEYLDSLDCEWVVLFNELLGQLYRGAVIKRYDRIINNKAHQSFKIHPDGQIVPYWILKET